MIDFGEYNIQYDEDEEMFHVTENMEGEHRKFQTIEQVIDFIKTDLESVDK